MSLSAAVGAPAPITVGDKTYTASPVTLFDLGSVEEHVRTTILTNAARAAVTLPADARDALLDAAQQKALRVSYGSAEVNAYLMTFPGTCMLLEASLRPSHPEVRATTLAAAFKANPGHYAEALATVMRVSGLGGDSKAGASGEGETGASEHSSNP